MFPFGVTFYPDQWPKDTWDESFRQIKSVGFNCVRFNEMAWDLIEPQPGKFNFKDLELSHRIQGENPGRYACSGAPHILKRTPAVP